MPNVLHTFDVFDTVLTRAVGNPCAIFLLAGASAIRLGLIKGSAGAFKRARIQAEVEARKMAPDGEVTLKDIYAFLGKELKLSGDALYKLQEIEIETERALLRPIDSMALRVAAARIKCGKVGFLSDMYLPSQLLRDKLSLFGLFQKGDFLWVSGEVGVSKASGKMFGRLISREGIRSDQIYHCGDNANSDIAAARRLGINALPFSLATPNRFEQILERHSEETGGATSYLAGASRLVRLKRQSCNAREMALTNVAAGVAGPALLAYVLWVLQTAQRSGLRKLCFLARDGQILLKIAQLCAPCVKYDGELKYLFASRQSWRLPGTDFAEESSLQWALEDTDYLSTRSFLERVGLRPEEVGSLLVSHGLTREVWDRNLDKHERKKLGLLAVDPEFRGRVASVALCLKEPLLAYLGEQGVLDGERFGIVDLGWHGSLQNALEQILRSTEVPRPVGFYFGLSKQAGRHPSDRAFAYFFDERQGRGGLDRNYWVEPILEVFCTADHGLTLRFERREGRAQPVLKTPHNALSIEWGLSHVQSAILDFVGLALANMTVPLEPEALKLPIHELLGEFWNSPTPDEAEAWGTYLYSDDQAESVCREWAEPLKGFDWLRSVYRGKTSPGHRAGWAPASLVRSARIVRWTLPRAVKVSGWIRRRLL